MVKRLWERLRGQSWELAAMMALVVFGYVLLHDMAGGTLLAHDVYDSYTLQAQAWLRGEIHLAQGAELTWLELAIYEGRYFVSFPPLPSVLMLPLVLLFDGDTPSNLTVLAYLLAALAGAYYACRWRMAAPQACFWATLAVLASNMMEISSSGGVWLQAQTLNMALLCWGAGCLLRDRRTAALLLFSLAVGCRPFSAVYILAALAIFLARDRSLRLTLRRCWPGLALTAVIAAAMMGYNAARFGDPLEFGHNYLPEFLEAPNGQFHLSYLWPNLMNILRPFGFAADGSLEYPLFDGFAFYLVNPLFLVWGVQLVRDLAARRVRFPMAVCCVGLVLVLVCLCMHKTFGGYQFGARYTLDMLPFALTYLILAGRDRPALWERCACIFGLLFNAYGTVVMRLKLRG